MLIFADTLLPRSNRFILDQGEALQSFVPYFIGARQIGSRGLRMPADRTLGINRMPGLIGKVRELPFRRFGFAPLYFRKLRKYCPVLMHAHSGPAGLFALPISEWLRIPQVTTFHGFDVTATDPGATDPRYGNRNYVRRKHVLMAKGQLFIGVSQFVRARLLAQGFPEDKIVVHYIGVDTDFFCPDETVKREPIALFVGRLDDGKGCEYAIKAMSKVQASHPEVELVIVGDGQLRADLESRAKEALSRFRFLGAQPVHAVRDWMNRASVFVAPSMEAKSGWTEAFGLVFAEAQAMGLPVASFRSGGISEAVAHGETGLLAQEKDWEGLAQNILTLLQSKETWQRMSGAGKERVRTRFNLKTQTTLLEEIYRNVISSSSSRCAQS